MMFFYDRSCNEIQLHSSYGWSFNFGEQNTSAVLKSASKWYIIFYKQGIYKQPQAPIAENIRTISALEGKLIRKTRPIAISGSTQSVTDQPTNQRTDRQTNRQGGL